MDCNLNLHWDLKLSMNNNMVIFIQPVKSPLSHKFAFNNKYVIVVCSITQHHTQNVLKIAIIYNYVFCNTIYFHLNNKKAHITLIQFNKMPTK